MIRDEYIAKLLAKSQAKEAEDNRRQLRHEIEQCRKDWIKFRHWGRGFGRCAEEYRAVARLALRRWRDLVTDDLPRRPVRDNNAFDREIPSIRTFAPQKIAWPKMSKREILSRVHWSGFDSAMMRREYARWV